MCRWWTALWEAACFIYNTVYEYRIKGEWLRAKCKVTSSTRRNEITLLHPHRDDFRRISRWLMHVAFMYLMFIKRLPHVDSTLFKVEGSQNKICGAIWEYVTLLSPPQVSSSDASVWKRRRWSTPRKLKHVTKIAQTINSLDAKVCIFFKIWIKCLIVQQKRYHAWERWEEQRPSSTGLKESWGDVESWMCLILASGLQRL